MVGTSALVGWVGAGQGFDWALAATFGTAVGTTLLAIVTGDLALVTAKDVRSTEVIARESTEANEMTRRGSFGALVAFRSVSLVHDSMSSSISHDKLAGRLEFVLVNAGRPPALAIDVELRYGSNVMAKADRVPNLDEATVGGDGNARKCTLDVPQELLEWPEREPDHYNPEDLRIARDVELVATYADRLDRWDDTRLRVADVLAKAQLSPEPAFAFA